MHELPVAESILEIALRHGHQNGAVRITHLHLVIGQLSSMIDDSIRFYWDMIAGGTIAEGARLSFRRIPVEMQCQSCQKIYPPTPEELACPQCGSTRAKVLKGDEFYLETIDIEKPNIPVRFEGER
jgi:hydrogenase nickel incorporation protein HypA/HybF